MTHEQFLEELIYKATAPGKHYTRSAFDSPDPRDEEAEGVARWMIWWLACYLTNLASQAADPSARAVASVGHVFECWWRDHRREDVVFRVPYGPPFIRVQVQPGADSEFEMSFYDYQTRVPIQNWGYIPGRWGERINGRRQIDALIPVPGGEWIAT